MNTGTKIIIGLAVVGTGVGVYFLGKKKGWFGKVDSESTDETVVTDAESVADSTATPPTTVQDSTVTPYVPPTTPSSTAPSGVSSLGSKVGKLAKGSATTSMSKEDSFEKIPAYMGNSVKLINGIYVANFNTTKQVSAYGIMIAQFYNNGRIWIYNKSDSKNIAKGNYYNGGRKIVITDGKNKGKTIESGSVWTNLLNILR